MRSVNRKFVVFCLAAAIGLAACEPTPTPALTPVSVQLSWFHQAQFAGFYAADLNGYYTAEGLGVSFVPGGPNIQAIDSVLAGKAQFGVISGDQMVLFRAEGKPLRAIAAIYRRSARVYIALAKSGITRPQDFVGKTIALSVGGAPLLNAMMTRLGISSSQYKVVQSTSDLNPLYDDEVQVRSVFLNNEVLAARAAGVDVNIIYPDDYGIHFYGDTIFTTDSLIATNPDLVLRFLRATLKGWTYAVENPTAIGPMVQHYAPQADAALETAKMTASLPLVNTGEDYVGWMKPEVWSGMEQTLRAQGVLTQTLDVTQAYSATFLDEIYAR